MVVMAETEKGGSDIVGMTMICSSAAEIDALKCVLAYTAAMEMTSQSVTLDDRKKILGLLMQGLAVGKSITVVSDERKFIIQKSLGVWFHVYAADADD